MMEIAAYAVLALSALGFLLSLVSHVCALAGLDGPLGDSTMGLHVGIFVVWLPAILFGRRLVGDAPRSDFWKVALRGCPAWMRYAVYGLGGYAILNFALMLVSGVPRRATGGAASPGVVRGFSGHWMLFYGAAFVITYSYLHVGSIPVPRCANGHEVGPLASYCERCGPGVPLPRVVP